MKIKTDNLTDHALDWAVGQALKLPAPYWDERGCCAPYSTSWAQGGPIIERERIELVDDSPGWLARIDLWAREIVVGGPTPLIAAMRCFVASKLGEEVDVPDELFV
jgi:hypothetical protein